MTLAVSTFYSDRIRCSIDVVGPSNLVTFLENTEAYRRDLRRVEYGDERDPKMREFLESIAPMNNIEKIKKPMMIVAGKNDPRVPVSESEQMFKALKNQGTTVWYIMAKGRRSRFSEESEPGLPVLCDGRILTRSLAELRSKTSVKQTLFATDHRWKIRNQRWQLPDEAARTSTALRAR